MNDQLRRLVHTAPSPTLIPLLNVYLSTLQLSNNPSRQEVHVIIAL